MPTNTATNAVDIAIVGAGAAGLATAIFAARRLPGRSIIAVDGATKLGAKILISGGGRCNVTNRVVTPADYCGGSPHGIRRVLAAFPAEQAVAFFREIGVELHEEEDSQLFPNTHQARTVLEALLTEGARCGVRPLTGWRVTGLDRVPDGFRITGHPGVLIARCIVLATGGLSLPKTGSDGSGYALAQPLGHSLVPTTPALVPLVLEGDFHASLSGVSHEVELTLRPAGAKPIRRRGALLWTHFGVSGPVVLDISRHWHRARLATENKIGSFKRAGSLMTSVAEQPATPGEAANRTGPVPPVLLNFLPGDDFASAERRLLHLTTAQPKVFLHNALATWLPSRVADAVLDRLGIDGQVPQAHVSRETRRPLIRALLEWPLRVRDSRGYRHSEVTAGGVPLDEIDPTTMASRCCPGLYLVGEILDVDGRIGGFNFQWAWSSAWVAATGLARYVRGEGGDATQ